MNELNAHTLLCHWLDGKAFFTGGVVLLLAALLPMVLGERPALRIVGSAGAVLGGGFLLSSGTPVAGILVALLVVLLIVWQASEHVSMLDAPRVRHGARAAVAAALLLAMGVELAHQFPPQLEPTMFTRVMVIGDSISAGTGNERHPTWPRQVGAAYAVELHDVAFAGATARDALERQLPQLGDGPGLLILEIGGNDVLRGTPPTEFADALDQLLRQAQRSDRTLVMFELPAWPLRTQYTAVQRRLAREHGVHLIPRRYLLQLIRPAAHTLDGIHLTSQGHDAMFALVRDLLGEHLPVREP